MRFLVIFLLSLSAFAFVCVTASSKASPNMDDLMAITSEDGVPYFCDWSSGGFKCGQFGITDASELTSSTALLAAGAEVIPFDMPLVADGYVWKFSTGPSVPAVIVTHENGDMQRFMYSVWLQNVWS